MPSPEYVDTNLIIRHLTKDNPEQAARAKAYLESLDQAPNEAHIVEGVITEALNVLTSKSLYALPRATAAAAVSRVLEARGLKLPNKRAYLQALQLYGSTTLDFVDAINATFAARRGGTVVSFDKDYDKIPGVNRREP